MRQKDDLNFFNLLNRIRIGMPSNEDIQNLKDHVIKIKNKSKKIEEAACFYVEQLIEKPEMVCLLPKLDQTQKFNDEVSKLLKIETVNIYAEDSHKLKTVKKKKMV